jgi:hypothetical protein
VVRSIAVFTLVGVTLAVGEFVWGPERRVKCPKGDPAIMDRQIDRLIRIKEELMKAEQRAVFLFISLVFGLSLLPEPAKAVDELQPQDGDVEVRNFTFRDGEHLPLLRLHYTALGTP